MKIYKFLFFLALSSIFIAPCFGAKHKEAKKLQKPVIERSISALTTHRFHPWGVRTTCPGFKPKNKIIKKKQKGPSLAEQLKYNNQFIEAARLGDLKKVKNLLTQGAEINYQDVSGSTALHWSVNNNHFETVTYLLQNGASVNIKDIYGRTELHLVANGFFIESNYDSQEYLSHKKRFESPTLLEKTKKIINLLIAHGADKTIQSKRGQTAYQWGLTRKIHEDILELLKN